MDVLATLPKLPNDVSNRLQYVDRNIDESSRVDEDKGREDGNSLRSHPSSFLSCVMNDYRVVDRIQIFLETADSRDDDALEWPNIWTSPVKEYNIEGLLYMAFPTFFSTGDGD